MSLPLLLARPPDRPLRLLCLGAHSDDIEIGCGGTILTILAERDDVHVDWVVFSASEVREAEARSSAERFLEGAVSSSFTTFGLRDGFFPYDGARVKEAVEGLKDRRPDIVLTHVRTDRHQDHRLLSELAWNTFRDHLILEYEIPKYDGDLGQPNLFVGLSQEIMDRKVALLLQGFPSQRGKRWFTGETFRAIARLRAIEAPGGDAYAEGFTGRKLSLGVLSG